MEENLTDSMYLILLTLLEPKHGYLIMQEISDVSHGDIEIGPASMYTILKKLLKDNLIEITDETTRKKVYRITPEGRAVLKKEVVRRKLFYEVGKKALEGGENNE